MKVYRDFSKVPLPDPTHCASFWTATKESKLCFPRCRSCGQFHWYPELVCPHCQSTDIEWVPVSGQGEIFTWTTVRYAFMPEFKDSLPLIVALVEFDDAPGVRFVTNIVECKPEDVYIGMPVNIVFQKVAEEITMPLFKPAKEGRLPRRQGSSGRNMIK